jgi:hypothetical protein
MVAGAGLDGDPLLVEVRKIDRHMWSGMRARGHHATAEAERAKCPGQHFRVGDVVVQHVHPLAAGEPHDFAAEVVSVVIDSVVGPEREPGLHALVGACGGNDRGADDVLRDLDADRAEIAAGTHDEHGLTGCELGQIAKQVPGGRRVTQDHRAMMEIESGRQLDRRAGRHHHHLGESAGSLDPHHADGARIRVRVLVADLQRHHARSGHPHAFAPLGDTGPHRVDDAGAIDAGDERKHRAARAFPARTQAHIQHPIDARRVNADANLALARLRLRHILVRENVRGTEFADDDRFHAGVLRYRAGWSS